jgi:hypothetical protein
VDEGAGVSLEAIELVFERSVAAPLVRLVLLAIADLADGDGLARVDAEDVRFQRRLSARTGLGIAEIRGCLRDAIAARELAIDLDRRAVRLLLLSDRSEA